MAATTNSFTTPDRPLTWLITGCSSGFGLAMSYQVLERGHKLIATSRNPAKTPELVRDLESKGGRFIALDVDDPNCGDAIAQLESEGTHIDILVNNAGFSIHQTVEQFTDDELRRMMETMYFGPARLMRAAVPHMRRRRFGVILNISSGAGLEGRASMGGYAPAKAALDSMTKVLAKELRSFNLRAHYFSMGAFNTNMPSAAVSGSVRIDQDYEGSQAALIIDAMANNTFQTTQDKNKAAKAIVDVALGQGDAVGCEGEVHVPLGRDAAVRVGEVRDKLTHSLEVFGELCDNMKVDA